MNIPPPIISTRPLRPNISGCVGKERRTLVDPKLQRQHTLLELIGVLMTLCRRALGSECHQYAIA